MGYTMTLFNKQQKLSTKPFSEKIAKRVAKIPTAELEMWADQALFELGRCLSLYNKHRSTAVLEEAVNGAEALHAVIDELNTRMTSRL
jgi:hypothetical protein